MFIILPFTFVLVDGALLLFHFANLTNAVRDGARAGSIWLCESRDCAIDPRSSPWDQYYALDGFRYDFIKDQMREHYNPLANLNDCSITTTYRPDPPIHTVIDPDTGDKVDLWNIYRSLDSVTVHAECPHNLLFGLTSTGTITLTGEATMKIEPGGVVP